MERWKAIPFAPGYDVSDCGRVRSWRRRGPGAGHRDTPLILKSAPVTNRYHSVSLPDASGRFRRYYVHTLVLEAFAGARPDGMQARHRDDHNRDDNRLCNLCWGTAAENKQDQFRHGTAPVGEQSARATISNETAIQILRAQGTTKQVAEAFNASRQVVWRLRRRITWKHLEGQER